ncbi:hypothetical protein UT300005_14760 [Clostridium sp. CTA-5]
MGILDWASDKVQTFTGEKERRELVQEFKEIHENHKENVSLIINIINNSIAIFNDTIETLNEIREKNLRPKINKLYNFLSKFGNIKNTKNCVKEDDKSRMHVSLKQFEKAENYIEDIDWSSDKVFNDTFFTTIFGARIKTKSHNIDMRAERDNYKLEIKSKENNLYLKDEEVKMHTDISNLYQDTVKCIDNTIENLVIPEMELIDAMLSVEVIKNNIIANRELNSKMNLTNDIRCLKGTIYEKHYNFIKNAFMFYTISSKIYDTPILTRLINNDSNKDDLKLLSEQKQIVHIKEKRLLEFSIRED